MERRLRIACWDCATMLPGTISPWTIATCPDTYSQPSASTARAKGRCWPPVPLPPSTPYRLMLMKCSLLSSGYKLVFAGFRLLNPGCFAARQKAPCAILRSSLRGVGKNAADPDIGDPLGGANGIGECCRVDDCIWIEENQIGVVAVTYQTTLGKSESLRGHARHF